MKKLFFIVVICAGPFISNAQNVFETQVSIGLPHGEYKEFSSFNATADLGYMFGLNMSKQDNENDWISAENKHFELGFSAGYSYTTGKGSINHHHFFPISGVIRVTYFKVLSFSFPIGYAIPKSAVLIRGGGYFAPTFGLIMNRTTFNVSYRGIFLDGYELVSINVGAGYKF